MEESVRCPYHKNNFMLFVNEKQHLNELCTSIKFLPWTTFKKFSLWMISIFFSMLSCTFLIFFALSMNLFHN